MGHVSSKRKPTFLWQGLLIVLPVLLLSVLGLLFLRQDRLLAEHDAAERAKGLADQFAPKLGAELTRMAKIDPDQINSFEVGPSGELVYPPPAPPVTVPEPLDASTLTPAQTTLWSAVQQAESEGRSPAEVGSAYEAFLKGKPPQRFAAAAWYAFGLARSRAGEQSRAAEAFGTVLRDYPKAVGETGLPLSTLAGLKLLELALQSPAVTNAASALDLVCSNAVNRPTAISENLLERAERLANTPELQQRAQHWLQLWQQQDAARALYQAAQVHSFAAPAFWFEPPLPWLDRRPTAVHYGSGVRFENANERLWTVSGGLKYATPPLFGEGPWLALRSPGPGSNSWYICHSEAEVGYRLGAAAESFSLPEYFGLGVEVSGRQLTPFAMGLRVWSRVHYMGGKGAGQDRKEVSGVLSTHVLASASPPELPPDALTARIYLTSPSALFDRQRTRAFWLAALICASALAALAGLYSAGRGFYRQQQLSALKSNFVSSVSHEMRAPLASVRLMAESLERGAVLETPRQREYFRFIVQECRRLSSLIENVLDFARIEQDRKEYEFEPVDLPTLVEQTVKLMEPYAAERGVSLRLDPAAAKQSLGGRTLLADGKALQQALVNLLDNAIKHSPAGQTVTTGYESRPATREEMEWQSQGKLPNAAAGSRERVCLWVEDNGEGIPQSEHEKIFERFYRRGSELRRQTQGVGIGLSIVKHIVEAHAGRVRVRSEVGRGSRFTIELPLALETANSANGTQPTA